MVAQNILLHNFSLVLVYIVTSIQQESHLNQLSL